MATLWEASNYTTRLAGSNKVDDLPHHVALRDPYEPAWEEFMTFAQSDQIPGYFSWDNTRDWGTRDLSPAKVTVVAMFSDPDAAFACKMRFG